MRIHTLFILLLAGIVMLLGTQEVNAQRSSTSKQGSGSSARLTFAPPQRQQTWRPAESRLPDYNRRSERGFWETIRPLFTQPGRPPGGITGSQYPPESQYPPPPKFTITIPPIFPPVRQPQYVTPQYVTPQYTTPQYVAPPYVPPVVTRAAPPPIIAPPETILQPLSNSLQKFSLADPATMQAVADWEASQALNEMNAIVDALPPGAKTQQVLDAKADIDRRILNGEPIPQGDIDKFKNAITASGAGLPPGIDAKLTSIQDRAVINAMLRDALKPPVISTVVVPAGGVVLVPVEPWPTDETLIVPGGDAVLIGTGGAAGAATLVPPEDVLGAGVGVGNPVPESQMDVANRVQSGVYLMNPANNGAAVGYLINGATYSMSPGYTQRLDAGVPWEIRFDRGLGQGEAHYGLQSGTYAFELTDRGWELRHRTSINVTIVNTMSNDTFQYAVDNAREQVGPNETRTTTSIYPIVVRFSRGTAELASVKVFSDTDQKLRVAINPADGLLDLFPAGTQLATRLPTAYPPVSDDRKSYLLGLLKQKQPLSELLQIK